MVARETKKAGLTKLPSAEKLKEELNELAACKTVLQAELRKVRQEEKEYHALRQNVDALLTPCEEKMRLEQELEK